MSDPIVVRPQTTIVRVSSQTAVVRSPIVETQTIQAIEQATVLKPVVETRTVQAGIQGQAGRPGRDGTASDDRQAEADSSILSGQPLYLKSTGHVAPAQANTLGTARVCGLASDNATPFSSVFFKSGGTLDQPDWSAVTGSSELTPGALYFLDPDNVGKLTTIAPTQPGQIVAAIGFALGFTAIAIEIQTIYLL